jgi:hypothetical protein
MRRIFTLYLCCWFQFSGFSQDSSRVITHEVGVNIFALLRQVTMFVPATEQLPYDIFYNCYFKRAGVRTGLGILSNTTETEVEGQQLPRVTYDEDIHFRLGASYQLVRYRKLTINCFADYIWQKKSLESATTSTIQAFPNPVTTRTVKSADISEGKGAQAGIGLMLHMNRHLSLYTETPLSFIRQTHTIEDLIAETGEEDVTTKTTTISSGIKIALPVTIYLVFRI